MSRNVKEIGTWGLTNAKPLWGCHEILYFSVIGTLIKRPLDRLPDGLALISGETSPGACAVSLALRSSVPYSSRRLEHIWITLLLI